MAQDFPEPRLINANGVNLAIYEIDGDPQYRRPPVILVHGWPDIAYGWKNIMPAIAQAGFRVIALDLKGFGRSDAPAGKSLYDIEHMTGDLAALLNALDIESAVFCGHDWGGLIVWPMAQLHGPRVAGVIGVSTPHRPPPPTPPTTLLRQLFTDRHYIVRFQEEGLPERIFSRDTERFFQFVFRKPPIDKAPETIDSSAYDLIARFEEAAPTAPADAILSAEDAAIYVNAYQHSGFAGGVNLYRNIDRNWEIMRSRDPVIAQPALWVGAANDIFLPPAWAVGMENIVPSLEKQIIADCGHWVMWERPNELCAILTEWLLRKMPA